MLLSGINKFSLIDYPGEVCCVVFTPGCNLRCAYCHNSEFVLAEKINKLKSSFIPKKAFINFLEKRKGKLTGVSICGGEPSLQIGLKDFCREIKSMGFKVKLDTNGKDPILLEELISEKLVDYIAIDIKHEVGKFDDIVGVEVDETKYIDSINLLLNSNIDYEFRTTVIKGIHDIKSIENICKFISGAKNYYIQNYKKPKLGTTLDPNFVGESFTEKELLDFKTIGSKYIKNIKIRN